MVGPRELLDKAEHYRRVADLVSDAEISAAFCDLARSYEVMAEKLLATAGRKIPISRDGQG